MVGLNRCESGRDHAHRCAAFGRASAAWVWIEEVIAQPAHRAAVGVDGLGALALEFERGQVLLIQLRKALLFERMHGDTLTDRTRVGLGHTRGRVR